MLPTWPMAITNPKQFLAVSSDTTELVKLQKRDIMKLPNDSMAQYEIQPNSREGTETSLGRPIVGCCSRIAMVQKIPKRIEIKQVVFGNLRQREEVVASTDDSQYHQHARNFGTRNDADLAECRDNRIFEGLKEPISANHEEDG